MGAALDTSLLTTTTRDKFLPVLKDNVYDLMPTWKILASKDRIKDYTGTGLAWDVVAKRHAPAGMFRGYSVIPNQPQNPLVPAKLVNANFVATVSISKEELLLNRGNMEKLIDILKTQMQNAEDTMSELLTQGMFSDGAAVGEFQNIQGFRSSVRDDNTYATIDRTATGNAFWKANVNATAHTKANMKDQTHASYMPNVMQASYLSASHKGSPDLIVTDKANFQLYQVIAQIYNLNIQNKEANLGFDSVAFGPGVQMIFDDYCPASYMYFLNTKDWTLFIVPEANLDFDKNDDGSIWLQPTDQLAKLAHIIWMGQLRLDTPRRQAVLSSLGAS